MTENEVSHEKMVRKIASMFEKEDVNPDMALKVLADLSAMILATSSKDDFAVVHNLNVYKALVKYLFDGHLKNLEGFYGKSEV
jgi:hypothetical protein